MYESSHFHTSLTTQLEFIPFLPKKLAYCRKCKSHTTKYFGGIISDSLSFCCFALLFLDFLITGEKNQVTEQYVLYTTKDVKNVRKRIEVCFYVNA